MAPTLAQLQAKVYPRAVLLGETATFTPQDGAYDAATDTKAAGGAAIAGVVCVAEDYASNMVDGIDIRSDDLKLTLPVPVAGLGFTPSVRFKVTFRNETWQVVRVSPIPYRGGTAAYTVQLRR